VLRHCPVSSIALFHLEMIMKYGFSIPDASFLVDTRKHPEELEKFESLFSGPPVKLLFSGQGACILV